MRVKEQSQTVRKGVNKEHQDAVEFVINWWTDKNLVPFKDWEEEYSEDFIVRNKMRKAKYIHLKHECDLVFADVITDENAKEIEKIPRLFIEIDGESHSAMSRQITDGLFEQWVEEMYPEAKLVRIPKMIFENTTPDLTKEELDTIYLKDYAQNNKDS